MTRRPPALFAVTGPAPIGRWHSAWAQIGAAARGSLSGSVRLLQRPRDNRDSVGAGDGHSAQTPMGNDGRARPVDGSTH